MRALWRSANDAAAGADQLALLRAHPDLAGKLALTGEMAASSLSEQAAAGLDQCSAEELTRLQANNRAYREKFGFPFMIAVRSLDRATILAEFSRRLETLARTNSTRRCARQIVADRRRVIGDRDGLVADSLYRSSGVHTSR